VLFAAKPKDLPSALALAQEVKSNRERYAFAATFAKNPEDKERRLSEKMQGRQQEKTFQSSIAQVLREKNPHFKRQHKVHFHADQQSYRYQNNSKPEPMEVDPYLNKLCPTRIGDLLLPNGRVSRGNSNG